MGPRVARTDKKLRISDFWVVANDVPQSQILNRQSVPSLSGRDKKRRGPQWMPRKVPVASGGKERAVLGHHALAYSIVSLANALASPASLNRREHCNSSEGTKKGPKDFDPGEVMGEQVAASPSEVSS